MVDMSRQDFEDAVGDALDEIPPRLAAAMDNVVVLVEDEPSAEQLADVGDECPDADGTGAGLLGIYEGTPLTHRDDGWAMGALPDRITIFRGPLTRLCGTRDELVEEVKVTVVHEIAHHFGIDDDRLHRLGWG